MDRIIHINKGFPSKPVHYISDGKYRDYYISHDSGGNMKEIPFAHGSIKSGINNKRFYSIGKKARIIKHFGDGTGRDMYIHQDNGGLTRDDKNLAEYKLKDFLRQKPNNYGEFNLHFYNRTNFPINDKSELPRYVTKREMIINKENAKIQNKIIDKLYYNRKDNLCHLNNIDSNLENIDKVLTKYNFGREDKVHLKHLSRSNEKFETNYSPYIFPHLRTSSEIENNKYDDFEENVKRSLNNFGDYSTKRSKLKLIIHNCHNINTILN